MFLWLKRWDKAASSRPDIFIANSQNVANSVKKNYKRDSQIVHPFADLNFFKPKNNQDKKPGAYYLVVSRLVKWKKIENAILACKKFNQHLIIIGNGPDEARLRRLAAKRDPLQSSRPVEFISKVSKNQLKSFYQNAKALIVTQKEDFGIALVEAQACGIPVIAYSKGGAVEIIKDKTTGILYSSQTKESLMDAIYAHSRLKWEVSQIRENVVKFSKENFTRSIKDQIKNATGSR